MNFIIKRYFNEVIYIKKFTFVELFAGIGGVSFGLERVGGKCLLAAEYDPEQEGKRQFTQDAYRVLHPETPVTGDVFKIKSEDVPDHDILSFTSPCQAFSVAGKRLGFGDLRGTVTFEALRIAKDKKPKVLFMENVKGLLSIDKGCTFETIVRAMCEIGYRVDFTVLNSKYFDVPQNRERVFIVAVRDDVTTEEPWTIEGNTVAPKAKRKLQDIEGIKTFNFNWPDQISVNKRLGDVLETDVDDKYYLSEEKTAKLVTQLTEKAQKESDGFMVDDQGRTKKKLNPLDNSPTLRRESHGNEPKIVEPQKRQNGRRFKEDGEESFTVTAVDRHGVATKTGKTYRIRKLTPRECFRLQAFSDESFEKLVEAGFSNSRLYKFAGNAVTVNVVEAIGVNLVDMLSKIENSFR